MRRGLIYTRISLLGTALLFFWYGYIAAYGDYFQYHDYIEPILFSSLFITVVLFFTFFIFAEIFKKWLIYFFIWLLVDVLWVLSADTKSDYFGLTPTKETASIYMGFILVYTSLIWFVLSKVQWHLWIKWFVGVISFIVAVVLTFVLT